MAYILGLSYNGDLNSQEQDKRLAIDEKSTLEKIASQFNGIGGFANPLHPTFSFDREQDLVQFRRSIVEQTNKDNLHYHSIDPALTV